MVVDKVMSIIITFILLAIGLTLLFALAPTLLGMAIVNSSNGYINNASGCYVAMHDTSLNCSAVACTGDVLVNGIYCAMFTIWPIVLVFIFILAVVGVMFGALKYYGKI